MASEMKEQLYDFACSSVFREYEQVVARDHGLISPFEPYERSCRNIVEPILEHSREYGQLKGQLIYIDKTLKQHLSNHKGVEKKIEGTYH